MKQNAAEKAIATLDAQIQTLTEARNAIVAAIGTPSADKPKRTRKRKGLPEPVA